MIKWILVAASILAVVTAAIAAPTRYAIQADSVDIQVGDLLRVLGRAQMDSASIDTLYGTTSTGAAFVLVPLTNSTGRLGSNGKRFLSVSVDTLRHTVAFDSIDYVDGGVSGGDLAGTLTGAKIWTGNQTDLGVHIISAGNASVPSLKGGSSDTVGIYAPGGDTLAFVSSGKKAGALHYGITDEKVSQFIYAQTSGGVAAFTAVGPASGTSLCGLIIQEGAANGTSGNMKYQVTYDASNNRFNIYSRDTDGSQTAADVIRIPDGGVAINGNGAFVDNQFDYVCRVCGYHRLEPGSCPKDGRLLVENNDAESIAESVRELKRDSRAQTALHRAGVLVRDTDAKTGEVWNGINLQGGIFYSLSAIRQQAQRITSLQDQIEDLRMERTGIPVVWILLGVGIGIVVVLARGRINRTLKSLPFLAVLCIVVVGSAYALTFEQKVMRAFKQGRYRIGSITELRDSIIARYPSDSTVRKSLYLDSLATEVNRLQTIGYIYQGTNRILLTNVGRAQADSVP